jgi:hypothetical protein
MAETSQFYNNLILDNPISQVIEDNSFYDRQVEIINKSISARNALLEPIGSQIIPNEVANNSTPKNYPNISIPALYDKKPNIFESYFIKSQRWIGYVIKITGIQFWAKLIDLNNPDTYEIGEFYFEDISPGDMELFKLGATFYWSVGLARIQGQNEKKSLLRFQRVNLWNESDYDSSIDRADDLLKNLNWDE